MTEHDLYMRRCIQLARNGAGHVAPNPMVGAVLVAGGRVLAEGWHRSYGGPHAEVECLRAFGDRAVPADAVMYVNLEPCSHHGRTPPCTDLLIARGVKRLVIGCGDPNPEVNGKGIARAREAGMSVTEHVLFDECRWLNRRFLCSMETQRPRIILKWARSADGFLDDHGKTARISSPATDVLVHRWRAEEQAIVVGSRTVVNDDPSLTARHVEGKDPLRVVIDRGGVAPSTSKVFDDSAPTLLLTSRERRDINCDRIIVDPSEDPIRALLNELHRRHVRSVLVEGGARLLGHFLDQGLWDEARVITGSGRSGGGTSAPIFDHDPVRSRMSGSDRIDFFINGTPVPDTWDW